ncbi:MAG: glycosyltransferase [Paludibacteraceae bacterium]|nr:glycosyltransferase [Paludibacteraceae bacterium]
MWHKVQLNTFTLYCTGNNTFLTNQYDNIIQDMLNNKSVAVIVAAYNEENQIGKVINTMPDFVDKIVVINDGSKDKTAKIVSKYISRINPKDITYDDQRAAAALPGAYVENENPHNDRVVLITHKTTCVSWW